MTDVQEFVKGTFAFARAWPGRNLDRVYMRLFDNWWERLAIVARVAPLLLTVFGLVVLKPMGYYWE
jgi:hypothetical protein